MPKSEAEIEREADKLEKEAKIEIGKKNYIQAIKLLKIAKDLNSQLGFIGQVGMINKKIARLENLVHYEDFNASVPEIDVKQIEEQGNDLLEKAQGFCDLNNISKAIELYNEALTIYDKLNFKYQYQQILEKIENLKSVQQQPLGEAQIQRDDSCEEILDLSVAKKRKELIQRELEKKKVEKSIKLEREKLTHEQDLIASKKQKEMMLSRVREREKTTPIEQKPIINAKQESDYKIKQNLERLQQLKETEQREKELIQKAEELLEKGNKFLNQNRFSVARIAYNEAIEVYTTLGWKNQVEIIMRELTNIDEYEEEYNETIRNQVLKGKGLTEEPKFTMEDFRRKKIREDMERRIQLEKERKLSDRLIQTRELNQQSETKSKQKLSYEERKAFEAKLRNNADKDMTQAKMLLDNKKFDQAKQHYREAIKSLKQLKWFDQVEVLYKEIQNIDQYKAEYMKKQKLEEEMRLKSERVWQQRIDSMLEMEKRIKAGKAAKLKAIPPKIKTKLEKINLLKEKAGKDEESYKFDRAINRYEYILSLYNSIPSDIVDLNSEKTEIQKKITLLQNKP